MNDSWISVDERLPELNSLVWLFDKDVGAFVGERGDTGDGWLWARAGLYYQDKHGEWQSADCEIDDFTISHWQPLPEPPKE